MKLGRSQRGGETLERGTGFSSAQWQKDGNGVVKDISVPCFIVLFVFVDAVFSEEVCNQFIGQLLVSEHFSHGIFHFVQPPCQIVFYFRICSFNFVELVDSVYGKNTRSAPCFLRYSRLASQTGSFS